MGYVALVQGATGAVGRDLVAELVQSPSCAKVVALTRREIPVTSWGAAFPSMDKVPADVNAAFSCLGTTRKDAGSAEAFRKVDLEYVAKFAELAKDAGVPYFGLLTASNANKDSWFLYPQTKGKWRRLARTVESIAGYLLPSVTTHAIARGMLVDYERSGKGLKEWSNADLKQHETTVAASDKQSEL
ncbi:hypothetical protein PRIC2_008025 [Phytophthora ramorum]